MAQPAAKVIGLTAVVCLVIGEKIDQTTNGAVEAGRPLSNCGRKSLGGCGLQRGGQGRGGLLPRQDDLLGRGILSAIARFCPARELRQPRLGPRSAQDLEHRGTRPNEVSDDP